MKLPEGFKLPLLILLWAFVSVVVLAVILFVYGAYLAIVDPTLIP